MDFSKLSYSQVRQASSELNAASSNMKDILDEIQKLFGNVGDENVWSGTAASSAKESFDALSAKFPEFYEAVSDCSKYLDQVVSNYENVDRVIQGQ